MMKKERLLKVLVVFTSVFGVLSMSQGSVYAQDIPVYLYNAPTLLDVTVPESINMRVKTNEIIAAVDTIHVINHSKVGVIGVENIHVAQQNGYTIVNDTTDFTQLAMNAKKFSLTYNSHDLVDDYNQLAITVNPTLTGNIQLSGKTGGVTSIIDGENCANVVLTIAYQ